MTLNGTKYVCDTMKEFNINDFTERYSMNVSEIESLGENIVNIGLKNPEDNSYAKFGLLIDNQKVLYIFGSEWYKDRGIYELKQIK